MDDGGEGAVTDHSWPLQSYYTAVSILKLVVNCGLRNPLKHKSRLVLQTIGELLLCGLGSKQDLDSGHRVWSQVGFWLVGLDHFFCGFFFVWLFFTLLFDLEPFISFSFSFLLFVCPFHLSFHGCSWAPHAVCAAPGEWGSRVCQGLRLVAET